MTARSWGKRSADFALLVVMTLFLASCAHRPGSAVFIPASVDAPDMMEVTVLTATDRAESGPAGAFYGSERGEMGFGKFTVLVRRPSGLERNLARDFVVTQRESFDQAGFNRSIIEQRQLARPIVVFVHGYNHSFQEAMFRLAQMSADSQTSVTPVLFSWPSHASLTGYVADRDAATYARDDLVDLLAELSKVHRGRITIVGHSMGGWLVMEALRQLRLEGRDDVIARLDVGLAAPDIDIAVFRSQAETVGVLSPPITLLVAADDRALALSQRLSQGRKRLGAIDVNSRETHVLADQTGVRIIDVSTIPAVDQMHHDRFLSMAALYQGSSGAMSMQSLMHEGVYVLDRSGALLSSVAN